MRQCSRPALPDDAAVVEDFLELGGGFCALTGCEIRLAANVGVVEAGEVGDEGKSRQLSGRSSLQITDGLRADVQIATVWIGGFEKLGEKIDERTATGRA